MTQLLKWTKNVPTKFIAYGFLTTKSQICWSVPYQVDFIRAFSRPKFEAFWSCRQASLSSRKKIQFKLCPEHVSILNKNSNIPKIILQPFMLSGMRLITSIMFNNSYKFDFPNSAKQLSHYSVCHHQEIKTRVCLDRNKFPKFHQSSKTSDVLGFGATGPELSWSSLPLAVASTLLFIPMEPLFQSSNYLRTHKFTTSMIHSLPLYTFCPRIFWGPGPLEWGQRHWWGWTSHALEGLMLESCIRYTSRWQILYSIIFST